MVSSPIKRVLIVLVLVTATAAPVLAYERWWNYYEHGIKLAEGSKWNEAIEQFRMALNQDSIDRRKARTYGVHYIGYYPHRMLGRAYMHTGDWEKAIVELSTALSQEDDDRTRRDLDASRKMRAQAFKQDSAAPKLAVQMPADGQIVNTLTVNIAGTAADDLYVATVTVNGVPASMLPGKEAAFTHSATLEPGKNMFTIEAKDGLERSDTASLAIICDPEPPVLSGDISNDMIVATSPTYVLRGTIADNLEVASVSINGEKVPDRGKTIQVQKTIALREGENRIVIEARDTAGNITIGVQTVKYDPGVPEILILSPEKGTVTTSRTLLVKGTVRDQRGVASITVNGMPVVAGKQVRVQFSTTVQLGPQDDAVVVTARNTLGNETTEKVSVGLDTEGPVVRLTDFPDTYTLYNADVLTIRGSAQDKTGIARLAVNGSDLTIAPGAFVIFSYTLPLKEGENAVEIIAEDVLGQKSMVKKVARRETRDIKKVGARLAVAVVAFDRKGRTLDWNIEEKLTESLLNVQRFTLIERMKIEQVLGEQAFGLTGAVDPAAAAKVGKLLGADALMVGTVNNDGQNLEIDARLVDVDSGSIITAQSAYGAAHSRESRARMVGELAQKFRGDYPLVDGIVVKVDKNRIYVDIGSKQGIRKDMRCVIYRDEEAIKHPVTGEVLGQRTRELGSVRLGEVYDRMSEALILVQNSTIRVGDHVLTK